MTKRIGIIGAGPAGLTAAYLLTKNKQQVTIFESDPVYVGGISRTARYKGYHFDIGGHRFFSKSKEVEDFWTEILPNDMLERPRSSRIFYRGNFFSYPLRAFDALTKLGIIESVLCVLSYVKAKLMPIKNPKDFQSWVSNQFGWRLFRIFFKTYTEKVWGMKCSEISADWAAQRIKGLSLGSAIWNAIKPKTRPKNRTNVIKTLIDSFRYPRKGPGMMWEVCAEKTREQGGTIHMGYRVIGCTFQQDKKNWLVKCECPQGQIIDQEFDDVISSAPMRELAQSLQPRMSPAAIRAAKNLKYRDFLTVVLILPDRKIFDDNWIYIHDPGVKVGRIQNFKSWSPEMVPDPQYNCYGLEYFCFEGDQIWAAKDEDLIALGKRELEKIGLASAAEVVDACVVRQPKAYPVYDDEYAVNVEILAKEIEASYPGLHLVGRNGMHKYNNQDHAMMTAMLCAENIIAGRKVYDLWQVNQDAEYHESGEAGKAALSGLRLVPSRVSS
ncbi:NAD(P)/FAD-dependent oxidoreductase [Oligoflexus tunisiensis]|uniref:NAD(P)/FAD-dependent oxidoreductase n=1 Tax=Oligoflexus tunisiensis TaxID=708132 RepID=UPI000A3DBD51|nr:NAD(P)/FAD-dependent oxidoreductase [Oligoflexus tunisiensis]